MGTRRDWNRLDKHTKECAKEVNSRPKAHPQPSGIEFTKPEEVEEDRLFIGGFPCGFVYCDTKLQEHGDFKKIAFLSYRTLELEVYHERSPLIPKILAHAENIKARKGERLYTDQCGHYIILGE